MYTYAFLQTPETPLALPMGIENTVQLLQGEKLSAIVEPGVPFEALQDESLMRAALDHDRVIRVLFEQTTILPLRFGTRFLSAAGLHTHLDSHLETYGQQLAHLTGKAEYTLKLLPLEVPEEPISVELRGREYFLAKKKRQQAHEDHSEARALQLRTIQAAVERQCGSVHLGESQSGIERIHLLAEREAPPHWHRETWEAQAPFWNLELTGPLPPYHFV